MKNDEILRALRRIKVSTGSLVCLGCGYEHNCSIHGCRILREAAGLIKDQQRRITQLTDRCARYAEEIAVLQERQKWIPVTERLPEGDDDVLAVVHGRPTQNIELIGALHFAAYCGSDACWYVPEYPDWDAPQVTHWMPLPDGPEETAS